MKQKILNIINETLNDDMFSIKNDNNTVLYMKCQDISNLINSNFYDDEIEEVLKKVNVVDNSSESVQQIVSYIIDDIYYTYMTLSQKDEEALESFLLDNGIKLPDDKEERYHLISVYLSQIRTVYKKTIFTLQQKELLLDNFVSWLSYSTELGKKPAKIEIVQQFYDNNMNFLVIKFKGEETGEWYLGLAGMFDDNGSYRRLNWSDFDVYDDSQLNELCKKCAYNMIQTQLEFDEMFEKDVDYFHNGEDWEEALLFANTNLPKVSNFENEKYPNKYQFNDFCDFVYNFELNNEVKWVDSRELKLLILKCEALVKLNRLDEIPSCVDRILKLSPYCIAGWNYYLTFEFDRENLEKIDELLTHIYSLLWDYEDFSKYLNSRALYNYLKGETDIAYCYLIIENVYSNNNHNEEIVNSIREQLKEITPDISFKDAINYLKNKNIIDYEMTKYNKMFSYTLIEHCKEYDADLLDYVIRNCCLVNGEEETNKFLNK